MAAGLLLALVLWIQVPVQTNQSGAITGVLKDSQGRPAVGVRVTAVPRPQTAEDVVSSSAMSSLAETDNQGRYTLEGVPPGYYYIAAGRLDFPTYFPGTQALVEGRAVLVKSGETVPAVDFALIDSSAGRAITQGAGAVVQIPLDVRMDNGSKVPRSGNGKVTTVQAVSIQSGRTVIAPLTDLLLSLDPVVADHRVTMGDLPPGYSIKSMRYGGTEVHDGIVKLSAGDIARGGILATVRTVGPAAPPNVSGMPGVTSTAVPLAQTLSITLTRLATTPPAGVKVTGQFTPDIRGAFLSGIPATIFVDGSYEFLGIQPGRHSLVAFTGGAQHHLGASLVVGARDVTDPVLQAIGPVPLNARTSTTPGSAAGRSVGPVPLLVIRGKVVDGETGDVLTRGDVFLVGESWSAHPLNPEGKFEFGRLLPGKYEVEVRAVGYPTFRQAVQVEEQDLEIELKSN